MEGTIQSAALFKNENEALPLHGTTAGRIAVIGPTAGLPDCRDTNCQSVVDAG